MIKRITQLSLTFFFGLLTISAFAQQGEIQGKVIDAKTNEGVPFANVVVFVDGVQKGGSQTDFNGAYTIKPLVAGRYEVKCTYIGYDAASVTGVNVSTDKITYVDLKLEKAGIVTKTTTIVYKKPLIEKDNTTVQKTVTKEDIANLPNRNINNIVGSASNTYQKDDGKAVQIKGSRDNATKYIVDGVPIRSGGGIGIPANSIEQLTVVTGGIPAKYGDAIGGFVNITTRGASKKFSGGAEFTTSKFLDPYGYYFGTVGINGPLLFKKEPGAKNKKPMLGYNLSFEWEHNKDGNPSAVGNWRVKSNILDSIQRNPLIKDPKSGNFVPRANYVTLKDMEQIKFKQNVANNAYRGAAKIDYNATDNITVAVGANGYFSNSHDYIRQYALFNSGKNPFTQGYSWRVFGRFTQKLGQKTNADDKEKKNTSLISNAYYTVQVDYSKSHTQTYDETHKFNAFDYGHVGKFNTLSTQTYTRANVDTLFYNGKQDTLVNVNAYFQGNFLDTMVQFTPGTENPLMANYASQYYNEVSSYGYNNPFISSLTGIQANNGLINGNRPGDVNGAWNITGRQYNGYSFSENNQFRLSVNGSVDLKPANAPDNRKHAIEFGFEFEQRVDRAYSAAPLALWNQMRLLVNKQIDGLDLANPHLVFDQYGVFRDTVKYDRLYNAKDQSYFDKALREKLGMPVNGLNFIQTDNLDPSTFSLDMFSPDELYNQGSSYVSYYGYDYTGKKLRTNPSYTDFFSKKDATRGFFSREINAYRPNYAAAYVQDKFAFRDLIFNVGVRFDRFDANTKILADPYSLYKIHSKSETSAAFNVANGGKHPDNIGDNYAVYVDDFTAKTPTIIGYRNGDTWYNALGAEVDPDVLAKGTATNSIQPYLFNEAGQKFITVKDTLFDPSQSFKDYVPQITASPRIAFSFPINEGDALFFAHYDVLAQRPNSRNFITPNQYYFFEEYAQGSVFNNPNLKPERTIDFQLGFEQKIGDNAALRLSGYYRESKNMIQVTRIQQAYPITYATFGNVDFATTKGFEVNFDLQKTANLKLNTNYSLGFADGTGSDDASQLNAILNFQSGNLRTILPLNSDVRHTFQVGADYRYSSGKDYNGPKLFKKDILANAGLNFTARARSGEPYTRHANVRSEALLNPVGNTNILGSVNGSRLPWNFKLDARADKDFTIKTKTNSEGVTRRSLYLNVYFVVQNVLNTKNINGVYAYTGNPGDDGYLASAVAQPTIQGATYSQGFIDQYLVKVNNPDNYSLPRRIRIGASVNF